MWRLFYQPFSLTLAVTYRCQSRCRTCRIWQLYRQKPARARQELSATGFKPLFASLADRVTHLTLTGGEPFLKKDLANLVSLAAKLSPHLSWIAVTTNGLGPSNIVSQIRAILEVYRQNLSVEISLDGDAPLHDRIRGVKGAYRQALQTYQKLNQLAQKNPRLRVYFSYTLSTFNAGRYADFWSALRRDLPAVTPDKINFNFEQAGSLYHRRGSPDWQTSRKLLCRDIQAILAANPLRPTLDIFQFGKLLLKRSFLKRLPAFSSGQMLPGQCNAGRGSFFIDPYGDVYPCITWAKKLGNIKDTKNNRWPFQPISRQGCPGCLTPCEYQNYFLSRLTLRHLPRLINIRSKPFSIRS